MIDMSINSEEPLEDDFYDIYKVLWERDTQLARENLLIVKLIFNPSHQEINVFLSADF